MHSNLLLEIQLLDTAGAVAQHAKRLAAGRQPPPQLDLGKPILSPGAEDAAQINAAALPALCFPQNAGNPVVGGGTGSQWKIGSRVEACDATKLKAGKQIEVSKAWAAEGGFLGDSIYACVTKDGSEVISGLTKKTRKEAKALKCAENGGRKRAHKITLGLMFGDEHEHHHTHHHRHGKGGKGDHVQAKAKIGGTSLQVQHNGGA